MNGWDVLRSIYLTAALIGLGAAIAQRQWFLTQPRKVRLLLVALSTYSIAAAVGGIELLLGVHTNGGVRVVMVLVATLTTLVAMFLPAHKNH